MRARRSVLALLLALALVATGCGGKGDKKASGGSTQNTSPAVDASDINKTPRDQVPDGGTLKWAIDNIPPNFNYNELDGTSSDNAAVIGGLLPGMFNFDASAQPSVNKDYLDSAELTAKDPKQVITYVINPKAKWSDGMPITEADFAAQWTATNGKKIDGKDSPYKISSSNGYEQIESVVKGKDEREVVVTFAQPYVDWKGLFSPLYPASMNSDPAAFNDGWKDKPQITAGPFKWDNIDRTQQTITVVRDDSWWGNRAKLDKIIYRKLDPDAHVDALANGEVDFVDIGPDVSKLNRSKSLAGVTIHRAGGPNFRHITMNSQSAVLQDVNVRKALALAIDRVTIARAQLSPLGVEPVPLNNHIFMRNQKGYKDNAGILSTADAEKAKSMLDAAGWKMEGPTRKKDGKELVIRFVIPTGVATSKLESELVQSMFTPIGAKVNIETVPIGDYFEKYITPGNFDYSVFSWIGTPFPISASKSIYVKPTTNSKGEVEVHQNYARIGSPEIDDLFNKATQEFDEAKAIDLGNQIDSMIWDEVHSLTLYQRPEIVATKANLANYGAFGFATARYEDIGFKP